MYDRNDYEAALGRPLTDEEWEGINAVIRSHIIAGGRNPERFLFNLMAETGREKLHVYESLGRREGKMAAQSYSIVTCARCGAQVHVNWLVRHRKNGCKGGIVLPVDTGQ